jgi:molybdate transport system substrate-binding protein
MPRRLVRGILVALLLAVAPASRADVLVFAAASLKNALDDAAQGFENESGARVRVSYAASSALARQIENGAPADIYISADLKWMDAVQEHGRVTPDTRRNFLGNTLVLIEPASSTLAVVIAPHFPLAKLLGGGRLAMADPDAVPAGLYGKAALTSLGVWDEVSSRVARASDVRAALRYVSRGEAPLGIAYRTDTVADPGVKIAAIFPAGSYPPIVYPIALIAGSKNADARKFMAFLLSPVAKPYFEKQGFAVLD